MILAIYGAGGLGHDTLKLAEYINKRDKKWEKIVFIDDVKEEPAINGIAVYKFDDVNKDFQKDTLEVVIALGEPKHRETLASKLLDNNFTFATLIYPDTYIPDCAQIGDGSVILSMAYIGSGVKIHNNVLINPFVILGHGCEIGENAIISGLSNIAGDCLIGKNTYVAMNCCVKEKICIGSDTIISMASVVARDIPDNVIAVGNPARVIKMNESNRVFSG